MKRTIKQTAELTGLSIRTLHWYDEIGLLPPAEITGAGYRLYNDNDLDRLQQIMFFRELGFELKEIKNILDNPSYDKNNAMQRHKKLLLLKKERIDRLITLIDNSLKGENEMSFKEFDMTEIREAQEKYGEEAKNRWGNTDAYKESNRRASQYSKDDWAKISAETQRIYKEFYENIEKSPESLEVQSLVAQWQNLITEYFYPCSKEILAGLGKMYVDDYRFTDNIDKYGKGLALFISNAIEHYCKD